MTGWVAAMFLVVGSGFMLVAAIGVWRFPDVFTRMQASAKAGTLGLGCLMMAVALHFDELAVTAQVLLIGLFFLLTSPVAMHRIARAAHRIGVPLWDGTRLDELRASARFSPIEEDAGAKSGEDDGAR